MEGHGDAAAAALPSARMVLVIAADVILYLLYVPGFLFFRIAELIALASSYPRQCGTTVAGAGLLLVLLPALGTSKHRTRPSARTKLGGFPPTRHAVTVALVLGLAYLTDRHLPVSAPLHTARGKTVVITGGNSGIGFETGLTLALEGATVILGCRHEGRCADAAGKINAEIAAKSAAADDDSPPAADDGKAVPLAIDLSSFASVKSFVTAVSSLGLSIDVLFNNAGFVPETKTPTNQYGLDPAFTSMHLSHYLLTELLLKDFGATLKRVVNTSSGTHHMCALPYAYLPRWLIRRAGVPQLPGCVNDVFLSPNGGGIYTETDEAAYIQSKVSNVMHALQIPLRHAGVEAAAIDLGWVGTSIMPFMRGGVSPATVGWMRSTEVGINPVLNAVLGSLSLDTIAASPSEESVWRGKEGGVAINVFGRPERPFSYPWWTPHGRSGENLGMERMGELAGTLWDRSDEILREHGAL